MNKDSSVTGLSEPRMVGKDLRRFVEGDIPTGGSLGQEEVNDMMRKRKVVSVTIQIGGKCGSKDVGGYERTFNISLQPDVEMDSEKLLEQNLDNVKSQVGKLIQLWKKEMN